MNWFGIDEKSRQETWRESESWSIHLSGCDLNKDD